MKITEKCNCGGINKSHTIGDIDCLREIFIGKIRKISNEQNIFFVEGKTITRFTLEQQRGFKYHPNIKKWSRPKDRDSINSIK